MTYWEGIHRESVAGFEIIFSVAPDEETPDFDDAETLARIDSGELCWFVARVEALKNGVLLGSDYLGGCCYDSPRQFIEASDYYGDMVENAIVEARMKLNVLGVIC